MTTEYPALNGTSVTAPLKSREHDRKGIRKFFLKPEAWEECYELLSSVKDMIIETLIALELRFLEEVHMHT